MTLKEHVVDWSCNDSNRSPQGDKGTIRIACLVSCGRELDKVGWLVRTSNTDLAKVAVKSVGRLLVPVDLLNSCG